MSDIQSLNTKINFIMRYVNDLTDEERKQVFRIIMESQIDEKYIVEKGSGIEIKFKYLSLVTIVNIYKYIETCLNNKSKELENFTE